MVTYDSPSCIYQAKIKGRDKQSIQDYHYQV